MIILLTKIIIYCADILAFSTAVAAAFVIVIMLLMLNQWIRLVFVIITITARTGSFRVEAILAAMMAATPGYFQ